MGLSAEQVRTVAATLLAAYDDAAPLAKVTSEFEGFDLDDAYAVLREIAHVRAEAGWKPVGRKIGFTNTTIWELFGVDAPMWATVWDATLLHADDGNATVSLDGLVQPRIEPEVAFKLTGPVTTDDDPVAILHAVEWMAPSFEIVQCHFPGWSFTLADATASFGLHARLIVGEPVPVSDANREQLAALLPDFELVLSRDGEVADRGVGANALGSPALALAHLARVVAEQPTLPQLAAGEVITTGTITNALSVEAGQTWTSDYGALGLAGLTVTFA